MDLEGQKASSIVRRETTYILDPKHPASNLDDSHACHTYERSSDGEGFDCDDRRGSLIRYATALPAIAKRDGIFLPRSRTSARSGQY